MSPFHPELPLDFRTFLGTPLTTLKRILENGEYCHFGIRHALEVFLATNNILVENSINLSFNIDGLPLFRSSAIQFWPILGLIKNCSSAPFVVGLFCGNSKPSTLESYLNEFVNEFSSLLTDGFSFQNKKYNITLHSFVCDAPARAFLKCIKSHSGYSSCEKCVEQGDYVNGRVILKNKAFARTDLSFTMKTDEDHHVGTTPLLKRNIGLVSNFPIDYMHCICLGVVRKLLNTWISGPLKTRLQSRSVSLISESLVSLKKYLPYEFSRKSRSLTDLQRWKATEFRLFLLYVGPIVLVSIMDHAMYENFLLLHFAISILVSSSHIARLGLELPDNLLQMFISHCGQLYGTQFLVYNVHILYHLVADVRCYGALDNFSAFPFENCLGKLKQMVKSPSKPLEQVYRRVTEMKGINLGKITSNEMCLEKQHSSGPLPQSIKNSKQFKQFSFGGCTLTTCYYSSSNCFCMTKDSRVVKIENFCKKENKIYIVGRELKFVSSFYQYPLESNIPNISIVDRDQNNELHVWSFKNVKCKCFLLPVKYEWVAFPLIHSL